MESLFMLVELLGEVQKGVVAACPIVVIIGIYRILANLRELIQEQRINRTVLESVRDTLMSQKKILQKITSGNGGAADNPQQHVIRPGM